MERMVLTAPSISSEHAIHVIDEALRASHGAVLVESNVEAKQVVVEFDATVISLDQIKDALAQKGFPVATAWEAPHHHGHGHSADDGHDGDEEAVRFEELQFTVRLLRDGVTAVVGYSCPCGCKPQARYQRFTSEAGHEHCCCGRAHFAGSDAMGQLQEYLAQRRADGLDGDRVYTLSERQLEAPWGGPLTLAFADPTH